MKQHPEFGYRMLAKMPYLHEAALIVLQHQERWDGKGYPQGLKGEDIVIGARIFCVADTLDAITSRPALPQGPPACRWRKRRRSSAARARSSTRRSREAFLRIPDTRVGAHPRARWRRWRPRRARAVATAAAPPRPRRDRAAPAAA